MWAGGLNGLVLPLSLGVILIASRRVAIVGGGPTGVELAGAFADLVHRSLKSNFRRIDTSKLRIILIECGFGWLPSVAWRLDKHWPMLKSELPAMPIPASHAGKYPIMARGTAAAL